MHPDLLSTLRVRILAFFFQCKSVRRNKAIKYRRAGEADKVRCCGAVLLLLRNGDD